MKCSPSEGSLSHSPSSSPTASASAAVLGAGASTHPPRAARIRRTPLTLSKPPTPASHLLLCAVCAGSAPL
eukprot:scaffold52159_cov31-Tisochrysis_lutea.AAC.8